MQHVHSFLQWICLLNSGLLNWNALTLNSVNGKQHVFTHVHDIQCTLYIWRVESRRWDKLWTLLQPQPVYCAHSKCLFTLLRLAGHRPKEWNNSFYEDERKIFKSKRTTESDTIHKLQSQTMNSSHDKVIIVSYNSEEINWMKNFLSFAIMLLFIWIVTENG